jgi:hypothetical protein
MMTPGIAVSVRVISRVVFIAALIIQNAISIYQWSFQQKLLVAKAGTSYGRSTANIIGRGYMTLISGYSKNDNNREAIYIHTTDNGYAQRGHHIWSQQAKLIANDTEVGDGFGSFMASFGETIVVSAPKTNNEKGALYIFNGTKRHWTQIQKLVAIDTLPGDRFGDYLSLSGDRVIVGAHLKTETDQRTLVTKPNCGAAYIFERAKGSLMWSKQGKLVAGDMSPDSWYVERRQAHMLAEAACALVHNNR